MKRQWKVSKQFIQLPDGQRRWDRAFQYLLQWTVTSPPEQPPDASVTDSI